MDSRTQERVEQWDSRPFSGGYDGLSDLTAEGFSGAVTAAGTWLFVLNGRIVGVFGGDLEDFETASGTIYEAPHPSLPLLFSMKSQGGDTRANYYTNDTSLEEVDQTLQDGSFTGYVELSENVLSGDYYAVYYGGRRMAAAFIGNAERLQTGDEAFERAADEVGIYEVVDVDVDVTDLPSDEPATDDGDPAADARSTSETAAGVDTASELADDPTESSGPVDPSSSSSLEDDPAGITATEPAVDDVDPSGITASNPSASVSTEEPPVEQSGVPRGDSGGSVSKTDTESADHHSSDSTLDPEEVEAAAAELEQSDISWTDDDVEDATASGVDDRSDDAGDESDDEAELEERFEEEEQWRETRSIPSIDPEKTTDADGDSPSRRSSGTTATQGGQAMARRQSGSDRSSSGATSRAQPRGRSQTQPQSQSSAQAQARTTPTASQQPSQTTGETRTNPRSAAGAGTTGQPASQSTADAEDPRSKRLEALETRRDELETKTERLEAERDRLEAENDELTDRVAELTARIDDLESRLEGDGTAETQAASQRLAPEQALSGTNLFVRYASKSEPTLLTAHDGAADRAEVAGNLHLEHHTEFDDGDVAVDGQPYEQFLTGTMIYQFVDWLTAVLLYEIRDTGHADRLGDLYDAIPRIDRAELNGSISLADDETEDVPESVTFDVVAYDKMGNPLLVVTVNDSREPASEELLRGLEEAASAVKANYPDLAAAMAVTSSYFEPGALEVTEEATSSGFLSRSSKASYVNVSRKQGYHLCLVESQSEGFHMTVPEL